MSEVPANVRCPGKTANGHQCWRRPTALIATIPLCRVHRDSLLAEVHREVEANREKQAPAPVGVFASAPGVVADVVYYVLDQSCGLVKIGTTARLRARIGQLRVAYVGALLAATEPGGLGVERSRHAQFADQRQAGEWFAASPQLMAWIGSVRDRHGILATQPRARVPAEWIATAEPAGNKSTKSDGWPYG